MPRYVILSDLRELTPSGFEMTCFWMALPHLKFRAKREIPMVSLDMLILRDPNHRFR